jgi:methyl-accepting chemotaxis protein
MKTSIKSRILKTVLISSVLVGFLISAISCGTLFALLIDNNDQDASLMAKAYSLNVKYAMDTIKAQIENVAKNEHITDQTLSLEQRKKILAEAAKGTVFSDFSVSDEKGKTYNNTDISEREYFKQAMNGNTYISSPVIRKTDGKLTIMVGTPLQNNSSKGIVYGAIDYSFFSNIISNIKMGKNGYGFILDKTGTIIAHPDSKVVEEFTNYIEKAKEDASYSTLSSLMQKMVNGESGNGVYKINGQWMYVAYMPVEGVEGWSIGVVVSYNEVLSSFWVTLAVCLATLVFLIALTVLISIKMSNSIAKPVKDATERLEALSQGDLNSPVEIAKTKDETLVLTTALSETVNSLKSYIGDIENVLSNISDGNLQVETGTNYVGDFAPIKDSLENILYSLSEVFSDINTAASHVRAGAEQVASGASVLSESASTEASTMEELSAMISEISNNTKQNAKNAKKASALAKETFEQVDEGHKSMSKMLEAMQDINNSSEQISRIIKVIDDIAFQTNILALNAAVEAARAGAAGKGFAVVADEVRALAEKSAEAANDTSKLIEESISNVQTGTQLAGNTAGALDKIVEMVSQVEEFINRIAEASEGQASAVEQINSGMEQITDVIQRNSATAEESAAASQELTGQANLLKEKIDKFKI